MQNFKNLIAGEWLQGARYSRNVNPSDTRDVRRRVRARDDAQHVDAAAAAAKAADPPGASTPQQRFDALDKPPAPRSWRARTSSAPAGARRRQDPARSHRRSRRAGNIFKFFAGEACAWRRDGAVGAPGIGVEITREPVGVVGLITPWNFPIAIPAWKIAPALAFGNCVVLKPADLVPGSAWALADIISRRACPAGVFNLVMGRGSASSARCCSTTSGVNAISFTGSVAWAATSRSASPTTWPSSSSRWAARTRWSCWTTPTSTSPSSCRVNSGFFSTGQRCTASSAPDRHRRHPRPLRRGHGQAHGQAQGGRCAARPAPTSARSSTRAARQDLEYIAIGKGEGATLAAGGEAIAKLTTPGFYMRPALFTDTTKDMRINREEIFGPVVSVMRVKNYEEALATANDTEFGLAAGIATTSAEARDALQAPQRRPAW
jgi:acyl-CoA reductase-like NAD-dependent aldehyde dehydrogenase